MPRSGKLSLLIKHSGTTGLPKGCPFNVDRGFQGGCSVRPLAVVTNITKSVN